VRGPANVVRLVVRRGALLATVGISIGLVGSLVLTRAIQSMLYATSATDPRIYAVAAALLIVVAILAYVVPARRATRVDPVVELRRT
jgi:putative ABC transport system permease protein